MKRYLFVGIGGIIGTLLRYSISLGLGQGFSFPYETLFVNVTGSFFLTALLLSKQLRKGFSPTIHKALTIGLLGSYTTFSAVVVEVVELINKSLSIAILYCFLSIFGSLFACYLAYITRRREEGC